MGEDTIKVQLVPPAPRALRPQLCDSTVIQMPRVMTIVQ